jgi:hypothetical protein
MGRHWAMWAMCLAEERSWPGQFSEEKKDAGCRLGRFGEKSRNGPWPV